MLAYNVEVGSASGKKTPGLSVEHLRETYDVTRGTGSRQPVPRYLRMYQERVPQDVRPVVGSMVGADTEGVLTRDN